MRPDRTYVKYAISGLASERKKREKERFSFMKKYTLPKLVITLRAGMQIGFIPDETTHSPRFHLKTFDTFDPSIEEITF